jgi:hypothetical protein
LALGTNHGSRKERRIEEEEEEEGEEEKEESCLERKHSAFIRDHQPGSGTGLPNAPGNGRHFKLLWINFSFGPTRWLRALPVKCRNVKQ